MNLLNLNSNSSDDKQLLCKDFNVENKDKIFTIIPAIKDSLINPKYFFVKTELKDGIDYADIYFSYHINNDKKDIGYLEFRENIIEKLYASTIKNDIFNSPYNLLNCEIVLKADKDKFKYLKGKIYYEIIKFPNF